MAKKTTKKVTAKPVNKRGRLRFDPDPDTSAMIDIDSVDFNFNPKITALVFSESFSGCGLVVLSSEALTKGKILRVKIGLLTPMKAEIVWRVDLDDSVSKLGLKYLDKKV